MFSFLKRSNRPLPLKITTIFCKDGYYHATPIRGTYEMVYRAAKGVYWDNKTSSLYFKGDVSRETALQFIKEAMENEYGITVIYE